MRIALATLLLATAASAQQAPEDLGTVTAAGGGAASPLNAVPERGTAAQVAPSRAPLSATQPTSVIGETFIQNSATPTENYDDIIKFSPSVQNVEPVGAGLQQNFRETIRGFNYTQFNTTFDGLVVPGLPTNFAPQSGAYFLAHDIGSVRVDRGPGSASTIGYATFGGTVDIQSKTPLNTLTVNPYATYGSYNTSLFGTQVDSGLLPELNNARGFVDIEKIDSNGYLSGTATRRFNIFGKYEQPLWDNTLLTLVGLYDIDYNHTPYGSTARQIATFGPNYSLNNNPKSQAYAPYNFDHYQTDYSYARIKSDLGHGFTIENTAYIDGYYQYGSTGTDVSGTTPNFNRTLFLNGVRTRVVDGVPGVRKHNDFRDYGDVLKLSQEFDGIGTLRAGFWYNYDVASAYRPNILLNLGNVAYTRTATANALQFSYSYRLKTAQPFIEFVWTPLPGLQITPGAKYTDVTRDIDAQINRGTNRPARFSKNYNDYQPSVDVRYTVQPGLVVYGQAAKGFLAPPLNVLNVAAPANLSPQTTNNYQAGVTYQRDWLSASADAYYIDFKNLILSQTVSGNTLYFNGGSAVYKGLEFEGTVRVGGGASLYGNYSLNDGNYNNASTPIASVPRTIAAAGLIEQRDNVLRDGDTAYASVIGKFIGPQYTNSSITRTRITLSGPIPAYRYADLAFGYTMPVYKGRKVSLRLNMNNVFDDNSLIDSQGTTAAGEPLFYVNPGRSFFVSVSASL